MDSIEERHEFGAISHIRPESIGEPGNRTFYITVKSERSSACLWLEKEQLYQLGIYMKELILSLPINPKDYPTGISNSDPETLEFKVGKLSLNADPRTATIHFSVHDINKLDETHPTLTFWLTPEQTKALADESLSVCASGRPTCPLCGQSINYYGHNCPKANGHISLQ